MKKNLKTLVSLLLAVILVLGLAACGSGDSGSSAASAAAPAAESAVSVATAAETAAAFHGKDLNTDPVKIAYIPVSTAGASIVINEKAKNDFLLSYPNGNVEINFFDAGYDPTEEIKIVNDCVAQGYDAILIEAADEVALTEPLNEAEDAGVVVIKTNMGCGALTTAYLNSYSYDAGWTVGEMLVEDMGETGKVILLDCPAAMTATTLHGKGFQDYVAQYPGIEIIDYANIDGFSQEIANQTFRDMLTKWDEIDAVYAMADDMAMGVLAALETAGRQNDGILVYGSEGMPYACDAVKEGKLAGTVWSDRYTFMTAALTLAAAHIIQGTNSRSLGLTETPWIKFPFQKITQDNVDEMIPLLRY